MHHSEDPNRQAVVFGCYVDDSGTDEQSPLVTVGAWVLEKDSFIRFDGKWRRMLDAYQIESLHMNDFVRPNGKYIGMYQELKFALFAEAVKLINSRKEHSLSITITNSEFKKAVPIEFYRNVVGPYTVAFIALALLNSKISNMHNYPDKVAYLVDEGSPFADQLRVGHLMVKAFENRSNSVVRTGALTFGDDRDVTALQASDTIAWSSRRKFSGDGLTGEFIPLEGIFEKRFSAHGKPLRPHVHYHLQDDIAARIMADVAVRGDALHQEAIASVQALIAKADNV